MAQFLSVDWDQGQLHLVSASTSRGRVNVRRAVVVDEARTPDSDASAEELGAVLRQWIKDTGSTAAPVLACLGRDRVILKEVRYPKVAAHEEADLIRFQVSKELTESPNSVVIDYVHLKSLSTTTENRALAFVLKRKMVEKYERICRAAGLRMAGLIPRPFGLAACLHHVVGSTPLSPAPEPPDAPVAFVTLGNRWAEFCVVKGEDVLLTRSLTPGTGLAAEIRRNLAVYSAQSRQDPIRALYLALGSAQPDLLGQLQDRLDVPVHPFDPFAGAESENLPTSARGSFAGAVGLLHVQGRSRDKPINFTRPKETAAPGSESSRLYILVALLVLAVMAGGMVFARDEMVTKPEKDVAAAQEELTLSQDRLARKQQEEKKLQQLAEWEKVNWLDELYEVAHHVPQVAKPSREFKLISIKGHYDKDIETSIPQKPGTVRPEHHAELSLIGVARQSDHAYKLQQRFEKDAIKVENGDGKESRIRLYSTRPIKFEPRQFTIYVRLKKRDPGDYENLTEAEKKKRDEEIRALERELGAP